MNSLTLRQRRRRSGNVHFGVEFVLDSSSNICFDDVYFVPGQDVLLLGYHSRST